ncbi:MAG: STAS domain-containing protein [Desulfobacterales bacterium]|nr:STAS domain-containing protein [Desulfobacterales bacterium]
MSVVNEIIDGCNRVRIVGALSIWEAAATWSDLNSLLSAPGPVEIDLTAVESCDGAGVQILCQLHKLLAQRPEQGHVTGISNGLSQAMRLAGLNADGLPAGQGEA